MKRLFVSFLMFSTLVWAQTEVEPLVAPSTETAVVPAIQTVVEPAIQTAVEPAIQSTTAPAEQPPLPPIVEPTSQSLAEPTPPIVPEQPATPTVQPEVNPASPTPEATTKSLATPAPITTPVTEATKADVPKTDSPKEEAPATSGESSPGFGLTGSIAVGTMTLNEEQVNRISYRPEISFGPLGVALDIELFINGQGKVMSYGWEFDTQDHTINSLYRKIYYVRWNQPGDAFYIRLGAIENITMDAAGLISSNYGNVALYPGQKHIGTHLQFNNWFEPWNLSFEVVNNSFEDWSHKGAVVGSKVSFEPLGMLPIPVLNKLRLGAVGMSDINQLATVRDTDEDGCPDEIDNAPNDKSICRYVRTYMADDTVEVIPDAELADYRRRSFLRRDLDVSAIQARFNENDAFTLFGFDYSLPIITSQVLSLGVYGEWARPLMNPDFDTYNLNNSWGLVPVGVGLKFLILDAGLEYRMLKGRFQPGHFDAAYEMERVRYVDDEYLTKEQIYWETEVDPGTRRGIYGRAGLDLMGFANVGATYSHLISEKGPADRSYTASAGLGKTVLDVIPKLSRLEAFYGKTNLGMDNDSFFERSIFTSHGYRVGFEMGAGMEVVVQNLTTYTRNQDGDLVPQANFAAETVLTF